MTVILYSMMSALGLWDLRDLADDPALLGVLGILYFLVYGAAGFFTSGVPLVSIILGLVLGPIAESELRRSLAMSQGDLGIFFSRPISASLIAIAVLLLGTTIVIALRKRARNRAAAMG